ncbi:MAG: histidinol-phosphatase [Anditalea sp.]
MQANKGWYKGNLHTHSYWSDGDEFPEVIMDWYKSHGYNFVALSDHNILAEGEKWVEIREDSLYQNAFQSYLENYGDDWVEYKEEDGNVKVKLKTFEEYKPLFEEEEEFLILQSEEISDSFGDKPLHMNATNIQKLITPQGGESVFEVLQNNINAVLKQREETGEPIMVHINHVNFHYAITLEDLKKLKGERFFEVYNGHPQVHNLGDSQHIGTEEMWDLVNIAYLQKGQPLLYGLATDDSHNYHRIGGKWSNAGRGWVMVKADSLNPRSLIEAMENGQFYSSTGVELQEVSLNNNKLKIEVEVEPGVDYSIEFIGSKKGDKEADVLQVTEGNEAEFELNPELLFVRAKVTSTKHPVNPVENMDSEMAWTQPVTFEEN